MKSAQIIIGIAVLAVLTGIGYAAWSKGNRKPNVMIVLVDTLRADHLGYNGYERDTSPVLDKFARENVIFRKAMSSSAWTPPSVASIFTGLYASVHGHMPLKSEDKYKKTGEHDKLSKLDDSFTTIAEIFRDGGYATSAVSANPLVSPKFGFGQGFDRFVAPPGREIADKINRRAFKLIDDLDATGKPFLLYVHYFDPHMPYRPPGEFAEMFKGPIQARTYPEKETGLIARYDGEIRYTDTKLGELFDYLRRKGLYDDMIIVFVSDHGEQFLERGYWGHADRLNVEEAHIPLVIKAGNRRDDIQTIVSQVDILPTLVDLAGLKINHTVHGFSLFSELDKRKNKGIMGEVVRHWNEKSYYSPEGLKLITEYPLSKGLLLDRDPKDVESEDLFDIYRDPWEKNKLQDTDSINKLRDDFFYLYDEIIQERKNYQIGSMDADAETLRQLKTLGYM